MNELQVEIWSNFPNWIFIDIGGLLPHAPCPTPHAPISAYPGSRHYTGIMFCTNIWIHRKVSTKSIKENHKNWDVKYVNNSFSSYHLGLVT